MSEAKQRGHAMPLSLVGLAGLFAVGLSVATASLKKDGIELNLTQETNKALENAGLPLIGVSFEGRAATLTGSVGDESLLPKLKSAVESVFGVRKVDSLVVAMPEETTYEAASVTPEFSNGFYVPPKFHPLEKYSLAKVGFVYAQATLTEEAKPVLDRLAMLLRQNPQIQIEISVHTDNQGTALGQIAASEARANSVRQYLMSKEVKPDQVFAAGYGATRPLVSHEDEQGRLQNRRVELMVLKDQ